MTAHGEAVSRGLAALLDGCARRCQLLAEQEEGPYRRGEQPRRRDVTEGRAGSPLCLGLRLRTHSGAAVEDADVEIWHCDADGRYSGYPPNDPAVDVDAAPQRAEYLLDETFLRGLQTTDGTGDVEFRTVYPGWYPGRTVHIHLIVHTATRIYTTQLYFPEDVTAEVFAHGPYRPRPPQHDARNRRDLPHRRTIGRARHARRRQRRPCRHDVPRHPARAGRMSDRMPAGFFGHGSPSASKPQQPAPTRSSNSTRSLLGAARSGERAVRPVPPRG